MEGTKKIDFLLQKYEQIMIEEVRESQSDVTMETEESKRLLLERYDALNSLMEEKHIAFDQLYKDQDAFQKESNEIMMELNLRASSIFRNANEKFQRYSEEFTNQIKQIIERAENQMEDEE
eukprot:NODE_9_length_64580_cov_1.431941.p48 type:complete len:121 gc:universal NODE_9_length_64580_cov_1.431941:38736-39098(+)